MLDAQSTSSIEENLSKWRREARSFDAMRERLWQNPHLRDRFVAIHHGAVVDDDADRMTLARRTQQTFPETAILIEQVRPHPRSADVPSPEVCG